MTIDKIYDILTDFDAEIAGVLSDTGFCCGSYSDDTDFDPFDPEKLYRLREAGKILKHLEKAHEGLAWMKKPSRGPYQLHKQENGRYGVRLMDGSLKEFCCGDTVEALLGGSCGEIRWAKTRIEHNGDDYYLYGFPWEKMEGMMVRERYNP